MAHTDEASLTLDAHPAGGLQDGGPALHVVVAVIYLPVLGYLEDS